MAAPARWVLCLCLGCLCLAPGDVLRARWAGLRRRAARGGRARAGDHGLQPGDKVSEHMLRLYAQYSAGPAEPPREPPAPHLRRGNTVRGFRPRAAGERRLRERRDGVGAAAPRSGNAEMRKVTCPAATLVCLEMWCAVCCNDCFICAALSWVISECHMREVQ